ncbi:MAG: hypothetical protein HND53_07845 [Proteobacteria bacterium]|nr:hypothetical protein [Pseudomonadota bacterium]NOG60394.1 hypothetical protein [Pseudomonadota bacterium]
MKWEYQYTKELGNNLNKGKSIIAQLSSIKSGNVYYYPHRYANSETLYYSQAETGIQRSSKMEQNGSIFLKKPFDLNTSWMRETKIELLDSRHESFSGGESFISQGEKIFLDSKIVSFDEIISVPAGVFKKTMRIDSSASVAVIERTRGIDQILIKQTEWYAKGIGLVKRSRNEISVPEKYNARQVTELIRFERD